MEEKRLKLGDAELEVMQVLWRAAEPLTAPRILEQLQNRSWAMPTIITVLGRLEQKGCLRCEKIPRASRYLPLLKEEDYRANESRSMLERLYGNSFRSMVASLYGSSVLTPNDLDELQHFLDSLKEGDANA